MFKFSICDPLIKEAINKGAIPKEGVLPAFRDFSWGEMLAKMRTAKESDIHFSPSIRFENTIDGHVFEISIVEDKKETVFYLFYGESVDDSASSELLDQTASSTTDILAEFVAGDYERVQERFNVKTRSVGNEQRPWWKFW
ncbi:MAG: hypothetical protein HY302_04965 [Opitutae bacterium]|nr:hypothetical protein [Opitutae bacterium]